MLTTFEVGYRHIDTAQMYENEEGFGQAIKESSLGRDDVSVTTKLNNGFHRREDARRAIDESLAKLGLDQVDLFLIHWPLPTLYGGDLVSPWESVIEARDAGKARSIGVSNFQPAHLRWHVQRGDIVFPKSMRREPPGIWRRKSIMCASSASQPARSHSGSVQPQSTARLASSGAVGPEYLESGRDLKAGQSVPSCASRDRWPGSRSNSGTERLPRHHC